MDSGSSPRRRSCRTSTAWTRDAVRESAAHPELLAIGIDVATALIVKGEHAEVVGLGTVSMHDAAGRGGPSIVVLRSGDRYDLAARPKAWSQTRPPLETPRYGALSQRDMLGNDLNGTQDLEATPFL